MPGSTTVPPPRFPDAPVPGNAEPPVPRLGLVVPTRRLPRPAAFWSVAVLLVLMLAASGVPSPLYRVYQEEFGFSSGVLTTVFGIYSFALLASLLVVGGLSDHVGRRPVLIVAFVLEAAAMALFLAADGVGWLLAARVVQGLATGALTSTLGAALLDLQRPDRPLAAFLNSASPGLGLSLGAVGAGLLVAVRPLADRLGLRRPHRRLRARRRRHVAAAGELAATARRGRVAAPAGARPAAAPTGRSSSRCRAWSRPGRSAVSTRRSGPSLVANVFGIDNHLVGGLLILALNGTGVIGSLVLRTAPPERALLVGALIFTVGVVGTIASLFATSAAAALRRRPSSPASASAPPSWAPSRRITRGVAPGHRAGLLAGIFVVGYLAFSVPAIAAGIAVGGIGLTRTTEIYGAAVVVLALLAVAALLRARKAAADRTAPEHPAGRPAPERSEAAAA